MSPSYATWDFLRNSKLTQTAVFSTKINLVRCGELLRRSFVKTYPLLRKPFSTCRMISGTLLCSPNQTQFHKQVDNDAAERNETETLIALFDVQRRCSFHKWWSNSISYYLQTTNLSLTHMGPLQIFPGTRSIRVPFRNHLNVTFDVVLFPCICRLKSCFTTASSAPHVYMLLAFLSYRQKTSFNNVRSTSAPSSSVCGFGTA